MVKAIMSTPVVRKAAATVMFATAVIGANASSLKTEESNKNVNQTEVVSKEAALALQSNVVKKETRSFELNKKMLQKYLEVCENPQEIQETTEGFKETFRESGTFGGTLTSQINLDEYYCTKMLKKLDTHPEFTSRAGYIGAYLAEEFPKWLEKTFYPDFFAVLNDQLFSIDSAPSAEACLEVLDNYMINSKLFNDTEKKNYREANKAYLEEQEVYTIINFDSNKHNQNLFLADRIAAKVHIIYNEALSSFIFDTMEDLDFFTYANYNSIKKEEYYLGNSYPQVEYYKENK